MANKIQLRRDTATNWTTVNPILAQGEPGVELDTNKWKIGNGTSTWAVLQYQGTQLPANNAGYLYNNGSGTLSWGNMPGIGTVTNIGMNMGTTGLSVSPAAITSSGTFVVTGTLAIQHGGTGATTAHHALNNLLPTQTGNTGTVLTTDGTTASWQAIPQYTLPTASTATLGGVKVDGSSIVINGSGVISAIGGGGTGTGSVSSVGLSMPAGFTVTNSPITSAGTISVGTTLNGIVASDGSTFTNVVIGSGLSYSAGTLSSTFAPVRAVVSGTTSLLNVGSRADLNIVGEKNYVLYRIQTSSAAWVTLYISDAYRTADASRPQGMDPGPNSGVIAEAITTGTQIVLVTPGIFGYNDEATPTTNIPVAVRNTGVSAAQITVGLTILKL